MQAKEMKCPCVEPSGHPFSQERDREDYPGMRHELMDIPFTVLGVFWMEIRVVKAIWPLMLHSQYTWIRIGYYDPRIARAATPHFIWSANLSKRAIESVDKLRRENGWKKSPGKSPVEAHQKNDEGNLTYFREEETSLLPMTFSRSYH